jgi:hypothetical protein
VSVLFTIAVLAGAAMWALAIYHRLSRMRRQILAEWQQLAARKTRGEPGVDGTRYNELAASYNAARETFPDSLVASLARFGRAHVFG